MASANVSTHYEKMSSTPIPRLVVSLAIPAIISMMVTNIYNLVDTAFVGQLGTSASGAVGIVFGFMSIIQAFGFMFGQGSGSILARALGQKNRGRASRYATLGFLGSFLTGAFICLIGFLFLDPLVRVLGSTETIAPYAKTYISYILVAAPFLSASLTLNSILRYEGKAALGMVGLMVGAFLNMGGDPILMFALHLGIDGAGLSTALSQIVSFCILLAFFLAGKTESKIGLSHLRPAARGAEGLAPSPLQANARGPEGLAPSFGNICATGLPSLLRQGLISLTTVVLNLCCHPFGDAAIAAMSIVSRLVFFAVSAAIGIGQGFQPVAAFSYGAGKYSRLRKAFSFTISLSFLVIAVAATLLILFSGGLIGLFRDDPEVIAVGVRALRLQSLAQLAMAVCMPSEMLFQSTGQKLYASFLSVLRNGLLFLPLLLLLSHFRGLAGIQEAQPLSMALALPLTIPFVVRFFRKLPKEDERS